MSDVLKYIGKVAVVTGAGGGLGRAYALLFGLRGARVVVNDLGGNPRGEGSDKRAADIVVDQIRSAGGEAVADYNSVEEGNKIVQTALDNFGRIDILVNNAGILRDRSFVRTSDEDWDMVHRVHLRGSFITTRAAFPYMKEQNYGKIIMTASTSGIFGNFGQANYSAAKLGLVGLCNTIAIEGQKYNISCNAIVPTSGTRMTEGIIPPEMFDELKPEYIAPMVAYLCHEDCDETGGIFEAAGGWFGKYRWERTKGSLCRKSLNDSVSLEDVRENWDKICDFEKSINPSSNAEAGAMLMNVLSEMKENENKPAPPPQSPAKVNNAVATSVAKMSLAPSSSTRATTGPLSALGVNGEVSFRYELRDVLLYALGVGVSTKDKNGLKFLYEGHADFCALPTYAVIPAMDSITNSALLTDLPGWQIDFTKLLHGEQYIELVRPLPTSGLLVSNAAIVEVLDKGSGAVAVVNVNTSDASGNLIAKSQCSIFIVGDGGFGGPRQSKETIPLVKPPTRDPDAVVEFVTSIDQAALYRLSGDYNPLHLDPDFAAMGGFNEPILHGLCSYGISTKAVIDQYCDGDTTQFKAVKSRFASPVIPGQTLVTSMWKDGDRVFFEGRVKETDKLCLSGGYVDLVPSKRSTALDDLDSTRIFRKLADMVADNPTLAKSSAGFLLVWNIMVDGYNVAQWTFDFKRKPFAIYNGLPRSNAIPSTTFTLEERVMVDIFEGNVSIQKAFFEHKIRLQGATFNVSALLKLLKPQSML